MLNQMHSPVSTWPRSRPLVFGHLCLGGGRREGASCQGPRKNREREAAVCERHSMQVAAAAAAAAAATAAAAARVGLSSSLGARGSGPE
jgi:hypothetical protein